MSLTASPHTRTTFAICFSFVMAVSPPVPTTTPFAFSTPLPFNANSLSLTSEQFPPSFSYLTTLLSSLILHCKENLISMSFDSTLVIWNLRSYQSESVVDSIECWTPNGLIEIPNRRVLIANAQTLSVLNVFTYEIETSIEEDINFRCFCRLTENQMSLRRGMRRSMCGK